jgi:hypothetical protein
VLHNLCRTLYKSLHFLAFKQPLYASSSRRREDKRALVDKKCERALVDSRGEGKLTLWTTKKVSRFPLRNYLVSMQTKLACKIVPEMVFRRHLFSRLHAATCARSSPNSRALTLAYLGVNFHPSSPSSHLPSPSSH